MGRQKKKISIPEASSNRDLIHSSYNLQQKMNESTQNTHRERESNLASI